MTKATDATSMSDGTPILSFDPRSIHAALSDFAQTTSEMKITNDCSPMPSQTGTATDRSTFRSVYMSSMKAQFIERRRLIGANPTTDTLIVEKWDVVC